MVGFSAKKSKKFITQKNGIKCGGENKVYCGVIIYFYI
jgi:hypothetical protein